MEVMGSSSSSPLTPKNPHPTPRPIKSPAEKNDLFLRKRSISSSTISSSPPFSSSSSSSSSHLSSPFTPSSPFSSFSSSVPFSWESQPGIPKTSPTKPTSPNPTLPLPPPLRPTKPHRHRLKSNVKDPFAVALMECSKDEEDNWKMDSPGPLQAKKWVDWRRRGLGFMSTLDLYASCKSTCSVADPDIYIRRSGRGANVAAAYGLLPRRPE